MSRDGGFPIADVATGHFNDPKVRRLWRVLGDSDAMARALTVHLAVVLASWGEGRRMTVDESAPFWLSVSEESIAALRKVGLLDRQGRLPRRSWDSWYGPAVERRDSTRERWRRANARRKEVADGSPRGRNDDTASTVPYRTVPSEPSSARAPARRGRGGARNGPTSLGEALKGTPLGDQIAAKGGD
jgi:hypothetical protein